VDEIIFKGVEFVTPKILTCELGKSFTKIIVIIIITIIIIIKISALDK
jgi:hypothetical protein